MQFFGKPIWFCLYLRPTYNHLFTTNPFTAMADFLENIGTLVTKNVTFPDNSPLEAAVEDYGTKVAALTKAGVEFKTLAGDNEATNNAGNSLIDLAGEIGTAFPHLSQPQADRFKDIVNTVYDNPDPAVDAAAQAVFNTAVDAVVSAQSLSDLVNTPPAPGE